MKCPNCGSEMTPSEVSIEFPNITTELFKISVNWRCEDYLNLGKYYWIDGISMTEALSRLMELVDDG